MSLRSKQMVGFLLVVIVALICGFWLLWMDHCHTEYFRSNLARKTLPLVMVTGAVFAYWVRMNFRVFYGIVELIFGGAVFYVVSAVTSASALFDDLTIREDQIGALTALIGAAYVIVRGMDNIAVGLPAGGRRQQLWNAIFKFEWLKWGRKTS